MEQHTAAHPAYQAPAGLARASFHAMGTTIVVVAPEKHVDEAASMTRRLFAEWEGALSRFQPESELSRLNAAAGLRKRVSPLLLRVLVASLDAASSTRGVFDPTILQRMIEIGYDRSFETIARHLPASIYSRPAATGGWRSIEVDQARSLVRLPAGVGLDFGGIAKGMAVDAALDLLEREGLTPALVNAGGDLATRGLPPGADSWALTVPGKAQGWVIGLTRGALATSGVARRRWTQGGQKRHHLIDPRTGEPAQTSLWSVTVTANTCAQAEVAAKTALILGEPAGAAFIDQIRLGALLARESGDWSVAGNWPRDGMRPLDQGASAWQGEIS